MAECNSSENICNSLNYYSANTTVHKLWTAGFWQCFASLIAKIFMFFFFHTIFSVLKISVIYLLGKHYCPQTVDSRILAM
ncbi:hypothetical protein NE645_16095, partial [Roseburia hominis]|nr:hypothetical protein [Roseburia hominis]